MSYIREVDRDEEFALVIGIIITSSAASPESRSTIHYILGGPLDNQH